MSATDIAKEVVRIASTHGLAKDVIDLLEKKLALLTDENAVLSSKVSRLEIENAQLRSQLHDSPPVGLVLHEGLLWKRTETGFEPRPYCPECDHHPVMMGFPPGPVAEMWTCSKHHHFDFRIKPPKL